MFCFLPGVDASRVYVHAWALGCFQSYQYPNLSEGTGHVGGQLCGDKECSFSGVTKCGRVWRKVPESDARSVGTIKGKKKFRLDSNDFGFVCAGISNVVSYKRNV